MNLSTTIQFSPATSFELDATRFKNDVVLVVRKHVKDKPTDAKVSVAETLTLDPAQAKALAAALIDIATQVESSRVATNASTKPIVRYCVAQNNKWKAGMFKGNVYSSARKAADSNPPVGYGLYKIKLQGSAILASKLLAVKANRGWQK